MVTHGMAHLPVEQVIKALREGDTTALANPRMELGQVLHLTCHIRELGQVLHLTCHLRELGQVLHLTCHIR